MAELVSDSWRFQDEEQNKCCHQNRRLRRGPVTDILFWNECYASMVVVLSSGFPQKTPEIDGISEDNCEGLPVLLRRWMGDI